MLRDVRVVLGGPAAPDPIGYVLRRARRWWHDLALSHAWRMDATWHAGERHWQATVWHCNCGRTEDGGTWR